VPTSRPLQNTRASKTPVDLSLENLLYFIGYKPSDFYTSLVLIVLKSKGKRGTRLIAESFTQTEKYIDFKRKISTQVQYLHTSRVKHKATRGEVLVINF